MGEGEEGLCFLLVLLLLLFVFGREEGRGERGEGLVLSWLLRLCSVFCCGVSFACVLFSFCFFDVACMWLYVVFILLVCCYYVAMMLLFVYYVCYLFGYCVATMLLSSCHSLVCFVFF